MNQHDYVIKAVQDIGDYLRFLLDGTWDAEAFLSELHKAGYIVEPREPEVGERVCLALESEVRGTVTGIGMFSREMADLRDDLRQQRAAVQPEHLEGLMSWRKKLDSLKAHDERLHLATGLRRSILELHSPGGNESSVCNGCDRGSYGLVPGIAVATQPPAWPCTTYRLVAGMEEE